MILLCQLPMCAQTPAPAYRSQVRRLLAEGKYREARQAAEQELAVEPRSAEAEDLAGTAAFALGDLAGAELHLRRALALQPALVASHRALAATYLAENKTKEARGEFMAVLAAQPRDFVSLYSLGRTFLIDGQPAEALKQFERASEAKPRDPTLLLGMLEAHLKLNQERQAQAELADLDSQFSMGDAHREQIVALLVDQGAYQLATHELALLSKAHPESYEFKYNLALAYHRSGRESEAAEQLHTLLAAGESAEVEDLLGDVELARGNVSGGVAAYRRATELEPGNEDYRYDYAQGCVQASAFGQALQAFADATYDFPGSVRMRLGLGATYYLEGRYPEAAQTLLKAAEVAPTRPEVYYLLGRAYDAAGPLQNTIEQKFAFYLQGKPRDAWAEYFYGRILSISIRGGAPERSQKAQEHLEKAVAIDGNLAEAHLYLGDALEKRGQQREAVKELERAVELDPQSGAALYRLLHAYRALGEVQKAEQAERRFVQLKTRPEANLSYEQIQRFLEGAKR